MRTLAHRAARAAAPLVLCACVSARPADLARVTARAPAAAGANPTEPAPAADRTAAPGTTPAVEGAPSSAEPQPVPVPPPDRTKPPWSQTPVPPLGIGEVQRGTAASGRHLRLGTSRGAVHVWIPAGYSPRSAGIVVYLHGYYTNADQAFADHRLAEQFRRSRRNALFLVPESPAWNGEDVSWPDLDGLLGEVSRTAGVPLPRGPVVAVGHSGAFRTLVPWLASERVREIVLLDALYRSEDAFGAWLAGGADRRLLLVGQETAARTEAWLAAYPDALRGERIPAHLAPRAPERKARLVYFRSQLEHMAIVTSGKVIPVLLQATRLGPL